MSYMRILATLCMTTSHCTDMASRQNLAYPLQMPLPMACACLFMHGHVKPKYTCLKLQYALHLFASNGKNAPGPCMPYVYDHQKRMQQVLQLQRLACGSTAIPAAMILPMHNALEPRCIKPTTTSSIMGAHPHLTFASIIMMHLHWPIMTTYNRHRGECRHAM